MTLHLLDVAPADVAAGALGFRVDDAPAPDALVSTVLRHPCHRRPEVALRLSILGASHAVTLMQDGHDLVTEEVSCRAIAAGGRPLTGSATRSGPWGAHRLTGTTETLAPERFTALVADLTAKADGSPEVLAGRFPGAEGSLTVVATTAHDVGWTWRSWHLYPAAAGGRSTGGGDVVVTESWLGWAAVPDLVDSRPEPLGVTA